MQNLFFDVTALQTQKTRSTCLKGHKFVTRKRYICRYICLLALQIGFSILRLTT